MNFNHDRAAGLSSPANNSLQQSLYIAALDRHLGIRGLISPVTDDTTGLDYDFFCPSTGAVIKIFRSIDQNTIAQYEVGRREKSIFIVDAVALEQDDCDDTYPNLESGILHTAATVLDAFLYLDDELYIFEPEGCEWDVVIPMERSRCLKAIANIDYE
jgi:hypothetical protein